MLCVDNDEGAMRVHSSSLAGIVHAFVDSSQTRLVQYWLNLPLKINLTLRMSNCIVSVIQLYMFYSCLICIIMYNEDFASLFCKVSQCTYNHNLTIYQCYNLVCQIYYILSSLVLFVIDVKSNLYIL